MHEYTNKYLQKRPSKHPTTYGQIERVNQLLEHMLRACVSCLSKIGKVIFHYLSLHIIDGCIQRQSLPRLSLIMVFM